MFGRLINGEKKMRAKLWIAGAVLATLTGSASANFVVTYTTQPAAGAGVPAGYTQYRFFAFNDQQGGTGTQLQSVDATMSIVSPADKSLFIAFQDIDNDTANDANFVGAGSSFAIANPPGSYIRVGGAGSFGTTFLPANSTSDPEGTGSPSANPLPENNPAFQNMKAFRVAGANTTSPVGAITGAGAQFAAAVVPNGTVVNFKGFIAGKTGPANLTFDVTTPEPGTVALLGVGAIGLLKRRRRNA